MIDTNTIRINETHLSAGSISLHGVLINIAALSMISAINVANLITDLE